MENADRTPIVHVWGVWQLWHDRWWVVSVRGQKGARDTGVKLQGGMEDACNVLQNSPLPPTGSAFPVFSTSLGYNLYN